MDKPVTIPPATVFCGIDVSAITLAVALIAPDQPLVERQFANRSSGHKQLLAWLGKCKACVRVSMEATGIYSLDLALVLDAAPQIELAVLNPKLVNRFQQTLARSKTDAADAVVLAHYSQRMPFTSWQAAWSEGPSVTCSGPSHQRVGLPAEPRAKPSACSRTLLHGAPRGDR